MGRSTNSLTPDQVESRAKALEDQAKRLRESEMNYEFGEENPKADPKAKSKSINIINYSFMIFGAAGIVGSFWDAFDMIKFTQFLEVFAWVWAPLVIMVGSGRAFKNFVGKKYGPAEPPQR